MTYSNTDLEYLTDKKELISFDNTNISYLFRRRGDKKQYVLFIHGLTGNYYTWRYLIPDFIKQGYGIIAPDLRGHFTSEKYPEDYSYESCAKDMNEILVKEGIKKVILITHCYGSFVGLEFHRLFSSKLVGFIFCSPVHSNVLKSLFFINTHPFRNLIVSLLRYLYILFKKEVKYNPSTTPGLIRKYYEFTNHWKTVVETFPYAVDYDGKKILTKINIPVLIIVGRFDWMTPRRNSVKMHKLIKNSRLQTINLAEHYIITMNNKKVIKIIGDYLTNLQ